ncbi:YvcK family protein [Pullulanibacillus sp. KACC 23026]|uniref:gluconeogenesis factor YvcK family protein n=1 Tax=Pullulanibacillus sp. KACC 23026 TaxID=3028315 RepID=UPI0023B112F1|nr:YvcK family protein [Pullulanibacillus sp. KACC 23026]WEG14895.1 YvcK family protein [Pullulanibacillus sp. KACC 23026]
MTSKPKIVTIGGGTGLSVLLRGLKHHELDLTAIVTVADDGGSSGVLRQELQIPPPGDIRNVLVALSETEPLFEQLFQHRFETGHGLSGHTLGNLLLAAMTSISGDFVKGIREISRVLNVKGKVLPAANQSIVLKALMSNGEMVVGESTIPKHDGKIKQMFLEPPDVEPLEESLNALKEADLIIIGPGSLYTSLLPNLLVPRLQKELCRSQAPKLYICNVMTQKGETDHFTASDHIQVLLDHVPNLSLDYMIVNNRTVPKTILKRYALEGAKPVDYDKQRLASYGFQVISDKIIKYDKSVIRHDETILANWVIRILAMEKLKRKQDLYDK